MIRSLAALTVTLIAAPLQDKPDKPVSPSEEFVEVKWDLHADDRFDYKWVYDEVHRIQSTQKDAGETSDHREVTGEIWFKEGENGNAGAIVLSVKKSTWTQVMPDHDVTVTLVEGKKPDIKTNVKGDPKASPAAKEQLKAQAAGAGENMKKASEGEFTLGWNARSNVSFLLRNSIPVKPGPSIFDKCYLHSAMPNTQVRQGQTWKEPIEPLYLQYIPTGNVDIKEIDFKVDKVTAATMSCKSGMQIPFVKPPEGANMQKVSGNVQFSRDFIWSRTGGYLVSSKEDMSFSKKVDASGKDAAFYKQDVTTTFKQSLTIKRKAGGKPEEKAGGDKN
jgi:hypothetical protein